MSTKDKLEEIAAALRARLQMSPSAEQSQNPAVDADGNDESGPMTEELAGPSPFVEPERENQSTSVNQGHSPLAGLSLEKAIQLRWSLRDIKAKRIKLTPVSTGDLETLIELGLVEIRDDAPILTNDGHQALD